MGWRRRYCPSPVLVCLAVAACVFYQSLTLLWKRTSTLPGAPWSVYGDVTDTQEVQVDVAANAKTCIYNWTNLYLKMSEFGLSIKKSLISSPKKRAFLCTDPSLGPEDSSLYKRILTKLGYVVHSVDPGIVKAAEKQDELYQDVISHQYAFIYIPTNKSLSTNCMESRALAESPQKIKKVNLIPEIHQLLCKAENTSEMFQNFKGLMNLSVCSKHFGGSGESKENMQDTSIPDTIVFQRTGFNLRSVHTNNQQKSSDIPLIRVFVLVTSLSPLRAFIHSVGIVRNKTNEKLVPIKLQEFYEKNFSPNSAFQALNIMKQTVAKLLLAVEVWTETKALEQRSNKRFKDCYQLLTYDIGYRSLLNPIVLEVKEHFQFEDLDLEDQATKEFILEDAFKIILQNMSISYLQIVQKYYSTKKAICLKNPIADLRREDIYTLYNFAQELTHLGDFELVYPSNSAELEDLLNNLYQIADPLQKLGSISAMHRLLAGLLEHFELLKAEAKDLDSTVKSTFPGKAEMEQSSFSKAITSITGDTNQKNCSVDDDTQTHIRHIFSNPPLDLTPEFNPEIKDYYVEVPFDVVTVEIGAEAAHCKSRVHLDERDGPRVGNYPLGLGHNQINIHVTDESKSHPTLLRSYRLTLHREDRPSLPLFEHYKMCGFVQDCGLIIHAEQPCGLRDLSMESLSNLSNMQQPKCVSGDTKGQWVVPCLSCIDNRTCDWRAISWHPYTCQHPILLRTELQQCLNKRKVLFIGDSTNRGMMYYLIERVNETLQEWQKSHAMKFYNNINNRKTFVSYSYYPQFWIDAIHRPTFEKAVGQLIERSRPLENTKKTVLVVGGVQWLSSNHLQIIHKVLKRENLSNILIIIKSIGMGFHLPVHGIRSLSPTQVKHLFEENLLILKTAKQYGYEVVDTFAITMGRYKEFLQGKCGCHFHEVVKSTILNKHHQRKMKLLKSYIFGGQHFPPVQEHTTNLKSPYHVQGPVNQVYSEILLSRMCS